MVRSSLLTKIYVDMFETGRRFGTTLDFSTLGKNIPTSSTSDFFSAFTVASPQKSCLIMPLNHKGEGTDDQISKGSMSL